MIEPFVGGLRDSHDGRGPGIAQAAWPAQNLPCDLPDDWDQMIDQAGRARALLVLVLIGAVFGVALALITGRLAGWL